MQSVFRTMLGFVLALVILLMLVPASVWASANGKPARSTTVAAGPYIVDVQLSQDPPYVAQPLTVTIVPQNRALQLSGKVIVEPGLGTDATNIPFKLSVSGAGTLQTSVQFPVKGAWQITVQLSGAQGTGTATVPVTVGAPGAMPAWLAWVIGSSPLWGIALWIFLQHNYRKKLLAKQSLAKIPA